MERAQFGWNQPADSKTWINQRQLALLRRQRDLRGLKGLRTRSRLQPMIDLQPWINLQPMINP